MQADDIYPNRPGHEATAGTEIELFSVAGRDGHLRKVNEAFARLLGLSLAEANSRSLLELVHPDDVRGIVTGLAALDKGATEVLFESRFLQRDGHLVHLQWVARPVDGTDLWWASGRDITEFHRLLDERTSLRTQLDLALGQSLAAMRELDFAGQALTWEPQAARILNTTEAQIPATITQLAATVRANDELALVRAIDSLRTGGVTEVSLRVGSEMETRHLSPRGRVTERDH